MKCSWREIEGSERRTIVCRRCNNKLHPPPSRTLDKCFADCKAFPFAWELGHWFAIYLAAAGITKGRWNWLRKRLGLVKPCGCEKREEDYNNRGARFARWLVSVRQRFWRTPDA